MILTFWFLIAGGLLIFMALGLMADQFARASDIIAMIQRIRSSDWEAEHGVAHV